MLTRRGVLRVLGTAFSAQVLSPALRAMELTAVPGVRPQSSAYALAATEAYSPLTLIHPGDENFDALIRSHFPGLLKKKRFGWIKNSAVLLMNTGGSPIHGFRFKWSVQDQNGVSHSYKRTFLRRPSLQLQKRHQTGGAMFLKPGEVGLLTPLFFWPESNYALKRKNFKLDRKQLLNYSLRYPKARSFTRMAKVGSGLSVLNRGVFLPAGIVGAGHKKLRLSVNARQQAEQDEASSLLATAQRSTASLSEMRQAAEINQAANLLAAKSAKHSAYYRARATFAQRVQYSIAAGTSMSAMVETLSKTATATKTAGAVAPACA